jgi:hypothetical protein
MISTVVMGVVCIVVFIAVPIGLGWLIHGGMDDGTPESVPLDRRILPHRVLPMENNVAADPVGHVT